MTYLAAYFAEFFTLLLRFSLKERADELPLLSSLEDVLAAVKSLRHRCQTPSICVRNV